MRNIARGDATPGVGNMTFLVKIVPPGPLPKGDLWVQSPMIIVGQSPNIMVGTAEGDLPKLFSPALLA